MFYIVETKEQLDYLGKPEHDKCFVNIITTNDNRHPSLTKPCLVYYNDGEKGYILPIDHSEAFKLDWETVKEFISSINTVYVLDKKLKMTPYELWQLETYGNYYEEDETQHDAELD